MLREFSTCSPVWVTTSPEYTYIICKGSTLEVDCTTITSHGFLSWTINGVRLYEFYPLSSNFWKSTSSNIMLKLTYLTNVTGDEVLYRSKATVQNVREETSVKCSDGQKEYILNYRLESMPISFYSLLYVL